MFKHINFSDRLLDLLRETVQAADDAIGEASAFSTLIRQRPPTPSCRGHRPYCGENSEPGRHTTESLTPTPELENGELDTNTRVREPTPELENSLGYKPPSGGGAIHGRNTSNYGS